LSKSSCKYKLFTDFDFDLAFVALVSFLTSSFYFLLVADLVLFLDFYGFFLTATVGVFFFALTAGEEDFFVFFF